VRLSSRLGRGRLAAGTLAILLASALPTNRVEAAQPNVYIENYAFVGGDITIDAGLTVTWINRDSVSHTVTSADDRGTFDYAIGPGKQVSNTFKVPGTFDYFCRFHPAMVGTIVVQASSDGSVPDGAMADPTVGTAPAVPLGVLMLALGISALAVVVGRRSRRMAGVGGEVDWK
jgi:plastocyanin